jgi:hypothetical protein
VTSGTEEDWVASVGAAGGHETRLTALTLFLLSTRQLGAAAGVERQHLLADRCLHVPTDSNIMISVRFLFVDQGADDLQQCANSTGLK